MEHTSEKRRSSRIGIRILGCLFCFGAILYIVRSLNPNMTGFNYLRVVIATVFLFVGMTYVKQSFAITAYDITYYIKPEQFEMETYRGRKQIAYEEMKKISMSQVSGEMDYYVIHILAKKYNLVIHILGDKAKAQNMYQLLLEFSGKKADQELDF